MFFVFFFNFPFNFSETKIPSPITTKIGIGVNTTDTTKFFKDINPRQESSLLYYKKPVLNLK